MTDRKPWFDAEAARSAEQYKGERDKALSELEEERRQRRLYLRVLMLMVGILLFGNVVVLVMVRGG